MTIVYTVIALVVGFSILVLVHEFGHYITAKMFHTKMDEFSLGMGPKIYSKKCKDITLSLRAIPLGGYVKFTDPELEAEEGKESSVDKSDPHLILNLKIWKRLIIYVAGAVMNLVLGFVLLVIVYLAIGMPTQQPTVGSVIPGSAGEEAGLMAKDIIIKIDDVEITQYNLELANKTISGMLGENKVTFTVLRNGEEVELEIQPRYSEEDGSYKVGFYYGYTYTSMPFLTAIDYSLETSKEMLTMLYDILAKLFFKGEGVENLSGPIGVVQVVGNATEEGFLSVVSIFISLTFNLAVVNMLPLPVLDGGKVLLLLVEAIRRKPLKRSTEGIINVIGFGLLLILTILISIKDVINL